MDLRKIKKLIDLLEESNLNEIEIKEGEESVRLSRGGVHGAPIQYAPPPMQAAKPRRPDMEKDAPEGVLSVPARGPASTSGNGRRPCWPPPSCACRRAS